jgi:hypothetical protein
MAQKTFFCKLAQQKVTILLNIWEDEYTGLESLKSVKCSQQHNCPHFTRKELCPPIKKIKQYYLSKI